MMTCPPAPFLLGFTLCFIIFVFPLSRLVSTSLKSTIQLCSTLLLFRMYLLNNFFVKGCFLQLFAFHYQFFYHYFNWCICDYKICCNNIVLKRFCLWRPQDASDKTVALFPNAYICFNFIRVGKIVNLLIYLITAIYSLHNIYAIMWIYIHIGIYIYVFIYPFSIF